MSDIPVGLREPWQWIQPTSTIDLLSRLRDGFELKMPDRERENLCSCAHAEITKLLKAIEDSAIMTHPDSGKVCKHDGKPCPAARPGRGPANSACGQNGICQRISLDALPKLDVKCANSGNAVSITVKPADSGNGEGATPCPDGEACPDARRYGAIHPRPVEATDVNALVAAILFHADSMANRGLKPSAFSENEVLLARELAVATGGKELTEYDDFLFEHLKFWKDSGEPAPASEIQSIQAWLSTFGSVGAEEALNRMRGRMLLLGIAAERLHALGPEAENAVGIYDNRPDLRPVEESAPPSNAGRGEQNSAAQMVASASPTVDGNMLPATSAPSNSTSAPAEPTPQIDWAAGRQPPVVRSLPPNTPPALRWVPESDFLAYRAWVERELATKSRP